MKEEKIIVSSAPTFDKMIKTSEIGEQSEEYGLRTVFVNSMKETFSFNPQNVVAVVAGNKGDEQFGGKEMDHFPNLKIITPFGIGYDHIDLEEAKKREIVVTHVPAVSSKSVAELTFGLILSFAHRITECDSLMKKRIWSRLLGFNLNEKKLGIIGLGNIGKEVALLARSFGMDVLVNDILYDETFLKENSYVERKNLEELLIESDIITLHVPLTDETRNMVNKDTISSMKEGVYIVNTARGPIISEMDLLDALKSKKVAGAALETFSKEPPFDDFILTELISHPRVVSTAHLATFTPEVQYAVASRILDNIIAVLDGRIGDTDQVIQ